MTSFNGFCPDCLLSPTTLADGGSIEITFDQLRSAQIKIRVRYPGLANSQWDRDTRIVPLSDVANLP